MRRVVKRVERISAIRATLLVAALAAAAGCATQPQQRDVELTGVQGVRTSAAVFDTQFSRNEYVVMGNVTGTGRVERRLVEDDEPSKESRWTLLERVRASRADNTEYYVLDYDRAFGTWTDEARDSLDAYLDSNHYFGSDTMGTWEMLVLHEMEEIAARIAIHEALIEAPEADAVISPRYTFTYEMTDDVIGSEFVIDREVRAVTATVVGKAVRIKTDEELYGTTASSLEFPDER